MSLIDMVYQRKTDLANGRVTYRRRKTGLLLTIDNNPNIPYLTRCLRREPRRTPSS